MEDNGLPNKIIRLYEQSMNKQKEQTKSLGTILIVSLLCFLIFSIAALYLTLSFDIDRRLIALQAQRVGQEYNLTQEQIEVLSLSVTKKSLKDKAIDNSIGFGVGVFSSIVASWLYDIYRKRWGNK